MRLRCPHIDCGSFDVFANNQMGNCATCGHTGPLPWFKHASTITTFRTFPMPTERRPVEELSFGSTRARALIDEA